MERGTFTVFSRLSKGKMKTLGMLFWIGTGLALWLLSAGCGDSSPEQLFAEAETAYGDAATLDQAAEKFSLFLERYPRHEKAPEALKRLAMIAQQKGKMRDAISLYERLLKDYPHSGLGDEAQFMIAFIYEEYIQDLDQAREAYQRVIDNYPQSELAASARQLLPNVGRDPEEWVEFQGSSP